MTQYEIFLSDNVLWLAVLALFCVLAIFRPKHLTIYLGIVVTSLGLIFTNEGINVFFLSSLVVLMCWAFIRIFGIITGKGGLQG